MSNTEFYKILGISSNASESEIRKAFRTMAREHHPDKGGSEDKFKEINKAYETLSDPEKRKVYDRFGENAENHEMPDFGDLFGLFNQRSRQPRVRKTQDTVYPLKLSLKDLYTGVSKKLKLTKNVVCSSCDGKGGHTVITCSTCHGNGVIVINRQIGPGMIQRLQMKCSRCNGKKHEIKDKCKMCHGKCTMEEKKNLEIKIEKGSLCGDKITFPKEGNQLPGALPGDVIIVIQEVIHPVFKRKSSNLLIKRKINLHSALTGFKFILEHLDGRKILINSDHIIEPGEVKVIQGEGMPRKENHHLFGNLYIEFELTFPKEKLITDKILLSKLLDQKSSPEFNNVDLEEHTLEKAHPRNLEEPENPEEREDSEKEEVQCRTQ